MPKFAANLSMMFTEVPFLDRFGAAALAGFGAVEFLFPYEVSPEVLRGELERHKLRCVLFNLPPGNWAAGERGITCIPGREGEFREGLELAIHYAEHLGTPKLHAMAGIVPDQVAISDSRQAFLGNLRYATSELAKHGMTLLIEAINTRDMPGFFLNTQAQAYQILQEVGASNLAMQMDLYHMQIMEGDLAIKLRRYVHHCGHIQVAGCPERNEPDRGEICFEYLFRLLDEIGYAGWIGCEYCPARETTEGLEWLTHYMREESSERVSRPK